MIKLLLISDVSGLGQKGDIVEVKPGFARHYLLPRKLAKTVTFQEIKELEKKKEEQNSQKEKALVGAQNLADQISGKMLEFTRKASPKGKIFGSISVKDIAKELASKIKIKIDDKNIKLEKPSKKEGEHKAIINLGDGIEANIKIIVKGEEE